MKQPAQDIVLQELKVQQPAQLLAFLVEKQVRKSRNAIKSLLAHKQIKVNGKIATQFDAELNANDKVQVMKYNQARKRNRLKGVTVVYEDEYIVVVEKEAGLLSVGTPKEKTLTAFNVLNQYVKAKDKKAERIYVLHRLDREISGLMIFAKDEEVQTMFQNNWQRLVLDTAYVAVIEGQLEPKNGKITSWLTENKNFMVFSTGFDNGGQQAITNYTTETVSDHYSQVLFKLETRRKNQIRAQMNQLQHPIVGDRKYGAKDNPMKRIALHALSMLIIHPITHQRMEFSSTLPKVMQDFMKK